MIFIGLDNDQKRKKIQQALDQYGDVDRIFVFHGDKEPPAMDFDGYETIYTEYPETEMYRTFYPLLGQPYKGQDIPAITDKSLLIVDEFMVTKNRSDLKYNCTAHFMRVSDRRLVFNYFPVIDNKNDFMILADKDKPDVYKGHSYEPGLVRDVEGIRRLPNIGKEEVTITATDRKRYEKKRDTLFDDLGQKDPDTIPRNLALTVGSMKKKAIRSDEIYVARNSRIRLPNVFTYANCPQADHVSLIDMHYRIKDFELFLRQSKPREVVYMDTGLPVDKVFYKTLDDWYSTVEEIYEETNLPK